MNTPRLHVVTDDVVLADRAFPTLAARVLVAGGTRLALHVRGHETSAARLFALASALQVVARTSGGMLLVNDRVDVAMAASVHGVQLGHRSVSVQRVRSLWPTAVIGCSVHAAREVRSAREAGADFVMLGTVYRTATHPGVTPAGPQMVAEAAAFPAVDIVAIGGVTPTRVGEVMSAGAAGIAVLSGIWKSANVAARVGEYLDALANARG